MAPGVVGEPLGRAKRVETGSDEAVHGRIQVEGRAERTGWSGRVSPAPDHPPQAIQGLNHPHSPRAEDIHPGRSTCDQSTHISEPRVRSVSPGEALPTGWTRASVSWSPGLGAVPGVDSAPPDPKAARPACPPGPSRPRSSSSSITSSPKPLVPASPDLPHAASLGPLPAPGRRPGVNRVYTLRWAVKDTSAAMALAGLRSPNRRDGHVRRSGV